MKGASYTILILITLTAVLIGTAVAGPPSARKKDKINNGNHQGEITAGSPDVFVNGAAAARYGDPTTCSGEDYVGMPPEPVPHEGGNIWEGSASVFINGLPAARYGDSVYEPLAPKDNQFSAIVTGSSDVFIGN